MFKALWISAALGAALAASPAFSDSVKHKQPLPHAEREKPESSPSLPIIGAVILGIAVVTIATRRRSLPKVIC